MSRLCDGYVTFRHLNSIQVPLYKMMRNKSATNILIFSDLMINIILPVCTRGRREVYALLPQNKI